MMNDTMKYCFTDCVTDFRGADLSANEKTCLKNCASRSFLTMQSLSAMQEQMSQKQGGGFWKWYFLSKHKLIEGTLKMNRTVYIYTSRLVLSLFLLIIKTELTINKELFHNTKNTFFPHFCFHFSLIVTEQISGCENNYIK